jgi:hypothetical protein
VLELLGIFGGISKMVTLKRKRIEAEIINSPFSVALGWKNKKGSLTKTGKNVVTKISKRRKKRRK